MVTMKDHPPALESQRRCVTRWIGNVPTRRMQRYVECMCCRSDRLGGASEEPETLSKAGQGQTGVRGTSRHEGGSECECGPRTPISGSKDGAICTKANPRHIPSDRHSAQCKPVG